MCLTVCDAILLSTLWSAADTMVSAFHHPHLGSCRDDAGGVLAGAKICLCCSRLSILGQAEDLARDGVKVLFLDSDANPVRGGPEEALWDDAGEAMHMQTSPVDVGTTPYNWDICAESCIDATVVLFNLFALEAWSICEKLGTPAVAVTPFLPSGPPPRFLDRLRDAYPNLVCHFVQSN